MKSLLFSLALLLFPLGLDSAQVAAKGTSKVSGVGVLTSASSGLRCASDTMVRANANPLDGNWATITGEGALKIVSNTAVATNTTTDGARNTTYTWANNQSGAIDVSTLIGGGAYIWATVRTASGAETFDRAYCTPTGGGICVLDEVVAGSGTTLAGPQAFSAAAGDTIKLSVTGTALTFTVIRSSVVQFTLNGTSTLTSGSPGFGMTDTFGPGNVAAINFQGCEI